MSEKRSADIKKDGWEILISVVIVLGPSGKSRVLNCLRSLAGSNYANFEVLLVDNGNNFNLTEKAKNDYRFVRVFKMPSNTGIFAYNVGYVNAKGKYIITLDDDCTAEKDIFLKVAEYFDSKSDKVGIISLNVINQATGTYEWAHYFKEKTNLLASFAGGACAFRKSMTEKIGVYDESFFLWIHEDDLALRAMDQGYEIHLADIKVKHFDKPEVLRPKKLFLTFRNRAWLNIKHFSVWIFPLLLVRDMFYGGSLIFGRGPALLRLIYVFSGYITGYLLFYIPLRKRRAVSWHTQVYFLKNFYLRIAQRVRI
jgi:GT2 family glycosyltransferase